MPKEYAALKPDLEKIIADWQAALSDGKITLTEFLHSLASTLAGLHGLVKDIAGDDAAYTTLRADLAVLIDERITPIDLPNVGPFIETNVVDPTIKRVVLGGLDAFRAKVKLVG